MSSKLLIKKIESILNEVDEKQDSLSLTTLGDKIKNEAGENESLPKDILAEVIAFHFAVRNRFESNDAKRKPYYVPLFAYPIEGGGVVEYPSIQLITIDMIEYWNVRRDQVKHPLLRARYAGLIWELSKIVTNQKADYKNAEIHIYSLLESVEKNLFSYKVEAISALDRALSLAISLNNKSLIEHSKVIILKYEDDISEDRMPGLWGFSYDMLLERGLLTDIEEKKIIEDLELRMQRLSQLQDVSPWVFEAAGVRLAKYYKKNNQSENVLRVLELIEEAFKNSSNGESFFQRSTNLMHLRSLYEEFSLEKKSKEMLIQAYEEGKKSKLDMKTFSHEFTISYDQVESIKKFSSEGTLEESLSRVAVHYIPDKIKIKDQILDESKKSPMPFLASHHIQDETGRFAGVVRPLSESIDDHIMFRMSKNLVFSGVSLRIAMESLVDNHGLNEEKLMNYLYKHPVFPEDKKGLMKKGLKYIFSGDHYVAASILIPQIEATFRNLVRLSGGLILKNSPNALGIYDYRPLGSLIRDKVVTNAFSSRGDDVETYLLFLLVSNIGWNMRNNIFHGISLEESFNQDTSNRLIHILLMLTLIKKDFEGKV